MILKKVSAILALAILCCNISNPAFQYVLTRNGFLDLKHFLSAPDIIFCYYLFENLMLLKIEKFRNIQSIKQSTKSKLTVIESLENIKSYCSRKRLFLI